MTNKHQARHQAETPASRALRESVERFRAVAHPEALAAVRAGIRAAQAEDRDRSNVA